MLITTQLSRVWGFFFIFRAVFSNQPLIISHMDWSPLLVGLFPVYDEMSETRYMREDTSIINPQHLHSHSSALPTGKHGHLQEEKWELGNRMSRPPFECLQEAVKKEDSGRNTLSSEHFIELFHGHVPQLSFLPVCSAAVTSSTQGHGQHEHMLFLLLLRLIWIMFHSLLLWKYQRSSCKSKPKNYS